MKRSKKRLAILKGKKGFTLVELIAVIVLLAIVSTIGSLSISSIGGSVKARQKNNLISYLKVQAKKYVNETGMKKVYVDTLIKEGYVQSDKIIPPNQVIVDPTDSKKTLNCYYFDFTDDEDGEVISGSVVPETGECDADIFLDSTLNIKYCDKAACNLNEYQNFYTASGIVKWIRRETIKLRAITSDSNVISQSEVDSEAIWTTPLAPDVNTKASEYELTAPNGYLEAVYQVTATQADKDYVAKQLVKIDAVIPTITNVRVENADEWKLEKHIYADFEDTGSGLAGYIITDKRETPNANASWQSISGKVYNLNSNINGNKITVNGTYYIYVKDIAGNISDEPAEITIAKIDTTAPECVHTGDNTTWINEEVEITWGCKYDVLDGSIEAPCTEESTQVIKYKDMVTKKYTYTISDEAGNTRECKNQEADIYSDTIAPACTNSGDSTTWVNTSRTIYYGCDDGNDLSKCNPEFSGGSTVVDSTARTVTIPPYVIKDNAGNSTTCEARTANVYIDTTKPECTNSGDSTTWTKNNRTIKYSCADSDSGCNSSFNGGSVVFNRTTKTSQIDVYKIKDNAGNETTCAKRTANVYVDKTAPTCTNSGDSTTWAKNNRTIYYSCSDSDSGCNSNYSGGHKDFNSTTKQSEIPSYTIKDNAGNQVTCQKRMANVYVDKTAPTCTNSGDNTTWTSGNRTINYGCSDNNSGCNPSYSGGHKDFTSTTKTAIIDEYIIKDNAGNQTTCSNRPANVYVDKTKPSVTSFTIEARSQYAFNSKYAKYIIKGSDSDSGIASVCFSTTNSYNSCTWHNVNSENQFSANVEIDHEEGSGWIYDAYAFVKDKVGNISAYKKATYTLYTKCDEKDIGYSNWSKCSPSPGNGTQSRTVYNTDSYLGSDCGTTQETQNCCTIYKTDERCNGSTYQVYDNCNGWQNSTSKTCAVVNGNRCDKSSGNVIYITYCDSDQSNGYCYDESGNKYSRSVIKAVSNSACTSYRCTIDGTYQKREGKNNPWITVGTCDKECFNYSECSASCGGGTRTKTCRYVKDGVSSESFTETENCNMQSCGKKICNTSSSELFGSSWKANGINVGPFYSQNSNFYCYDYWGNNQYGCYRKNGFQRKCVFSGCSGTDYDGSHYNYYNQTAEWLNRNLGCSFVLYWCTCPNNPTVPIYEV